MWRGIQRSLAAWVAERDIGGVKAEGHLKRRFWPQVVSRVRVVKKLKLFHVKLIRSLHHEGVATADQLSADARDVRSCPEARCPAPTLTVQVVRMTGAPPSMVVATSWSPLKWSAVSPAPAGTPRSLA